MSEESSANKGPSMKDNNNIQENRGSQVREPMLWEAIIPIISLLGLFAVAIVGKMNSTPFLIVAAVIAGIIAWKCGISWPQMEKAIAVKIEKVMPAELILICVGLLIASWMYSGTIPMIIYWGVKLISQKFIIVSTFLCCAVFSIVTGTSWGSAGTAGLAMMSIATGMNANLAAVAGAAYAGAIFGDKLSPLSDTTILASLVAEQDIFKHIRNMLFTTVPAAVIGIVIYLFIGSHSTNANIALPENTLAMMNTLQALFNFNLIVLLPMAIVLAGSLMKKPSVLVMLTSVAAAFLIGLFVQKLSFADGVNCLMNGFTCDYLAKAHPEFDMGTISKDAVRLLQRGGLMSMMEAMLVTICAYSFAAIVELAGCLRVALKTMLGHVRTTGGLIASTVASGLLLAGVGGDTWVSILMTGEIFRDKYIEKGLSTLAMSRTLEDTCTMSIGMFPWTASGVYYAGVFGVANLAFAPYAVMCWLCMPLAILYGYTNLFIVKAEPEWLAKKRIESAKMAEIKAGNVDID